MGQSRDFKGVVKNLGSSDRDLGFSSDSTSYQLCGLGLNTSPEPQFPFLSDGVNDSAYPLGLLEAKRTEKCQVHTSLFP